MVILIAGATHAGKTALSQRLLEKYHYPYVSIDHLKMGLIRSGNTALTPEDDEALEAYLWPIVREMIKTAIENGQNLIVEGVYIPFDWKASFEEKEKEAIAYVCLIMSEAYILSHFSDIQAHASTIEQRMEDSGLSPDALISENRANLQRCRQHGCPYILIDGDYQASLERGMEKLSL